ncbi:glutathione S-transferase Mu 1-like [Dermacentor variabilis]|uniref:glutathione S-transferase Mu 1-like n=1 Tax=Dermacentor variabilis TaxID=34621 RepID=UPI003F5C08D0
MPANSSKDQKTGKPGKVILGYWANIRGIVEPIRCMLEYAGVPYEYKTYPWLDKPTPQESKAMWLQEKAALAERGFAFPNLPYLVDGEDAKIVQSLAIMRYLARKHGLAVPDSKPALAARVDMLEGQINELRWYLIFYCWEDYVATLKGDFAEALPGQLELLSRSLADRKWLAGDQITHVDFMLYELLDQFLLFKPGCLNEHANLKAYVERFRQLTPIKAYLSSDRFQPWPVFLPVAKRWGCGKPPASLVGKHAKA